MGSDSRNIAAFSWRRIQMGWRTQSGTPDSGDSGTKAVWTMTTILITRNKRGIWLATTDNPMMPRLCRTVPVFSEAENDEHVSWEEVRKRVAECNPGNRIVLSGEAS